VREWTVMGASVALFVTLAACQAREPQPPAVTAPPAPETKAPGAATVTFATADGWDLAATYWPGAGAAPRPAAILLHMLPADRHSYDELGPLLATAGGFDVVALDSRGHGESLKHAGKTERYTSFDAAAYNASVGDVAAAKTWLSQKGADVKRLVLVGASIGANFALIYAAGDADVKGVVLLSPGLDYHGVKTEDAMKKYGARPAYLIASGEDADAAACIERLHQLAPGADFKMYEGAGHGTNMFGPEPDLPQLLVTWLAARVK